MNKTQLSLLITTLASALLLTGLLAFPPSMPSLTPTGPSAEPSNTSGSTLPEVLRTGPPQAHRTSPDLACQNRLPPDAPHTSSDDSCLVALSDVLRHATVQPDKILRTSGTVVGIRPSVELLLADGKGSYIMVTFSRASTHRFEHYFSTLVVGDRVEVEGRPRVVRGVLRESRTGLLIEIVGVDLSQALEFGIVSLTAISKLN